MMGGAGALDGGGPVEPAPQAELPRRVRRARTGTGRTAPGTEPSGARPAGPGTAGTGPAGPWTPRIRPAAAGATGTGPGRPGAGPAGPGTPGTAPGTPGTGPAQGGNDQSETGRPGTGRTGPDWTATDWTGTAGTESTAPGSPRTGTPAPRPGRPAGSDPESRRGGTGTGATRAAGRTSGQDRAAIRPAPGHALPRRAASGRAAKGAAPGQDARGRSRPAADAARGVAGESARPAEADAARLPWYEVAHARRAAEGYQNCGPLERVLRREWPPSKVPSPPVVRAVNRLAELPLMIKQILAAGVDAIHVGEGGVPELDDMARLRGVPLPSGRATWDACAGAYGEKKIIVGSRPSSAPDVMCHEVGHALDDIDREQGRWQSDSTEFRHLYQRCEGSLVSDFHKQSGDLGRREFFADAFAAIASRQRPALVDMLGGNIRTALDVMLYFNLRYGL
jgi:hypothetical protein